MKYMALTVIQLKFTKNYFEGGKNEKIRESEREIKKYQMDGQIDKEILDRYIVNSSSWNGPVFLNFLYFKLLFFYSG